MLLKVLLFDLGGVVVKFGGFEALRELLPGSPDLRAIRQRWITSDSVRRSEAGQISDREFGESFVKEWGLGMAPGNLRLFT